MLYPWVFIVNRNNFEKYIVYFARFFWFVRISEILKRLIHVLFLLIHPGKCIFYLNMPVISFVRKLYLVMDEVFVAVSLPTINSRSRIESWACVQTWGAKSEIYPTKNIAFLLLRISWGIYLRLGTITNIINFTISNDKEWKEPFRGIWL